MVFNAQGLLIFLLVIPCLLSAQQDFEAYQYEKDGKVLLYQLLKPASIDTSYRYPLILYLHGAGSRGDDNEKPTTHIKPFVLNEQYRSDYPCYVLVPQCPKGHRWVETDWTLPAHQQPDTPSAPMQLLMQLLEEIDNDHYIDPQCQYVTGISMGGFGTWDIIDRMPNRFSAAAPICGGADTSTATNIAHIPIWCFHGDNDKAVMVKRSRDMHQAMERVDGKMKYTEYPGVGHGSWIRAYADPRLMKWLFTY